MTRCASVLFILLFLVSNLFSQREIMEILKPPISDIPARTLEEAGIQGDSLRALIHAIGSANPPDFRGIVIMKNNQILLEEYYGTYWRSSLHDIRSAGKSLTGLLMGIAIDKGLVKGVKEPFLQYFPKLKKEKEWRKGLDKVTIQDLLTMSTGMDADANDLKSKGNELYLLASQDWIQFALDLPLVFEPGTAYRYNSVAAMLVGAVIENASGMTLSDFAKAHLFLPLGIKDFYWWAGPKGRVAGMGNIYLSTLDFAKIGALVANKGKWKKQQIISTAWINALSTKHLDISRQDPFADGYGYLWYISTTGPHRYFFASGNGGNKLYVVPDLGLSVAILSSAYGRGHGHARAENIIQLLLRSVE